MTTREVLLAYSERRVKADKRPWATKHHPVFKKPGLNLTHDGSREPSSEIFKSNHLIINFQTI